MQLRTLVKIVLSWYAEHTSIVYLSIVIIDSDGLVIHLSIVIIDSEASVNKEIKTINNQAKAKAVPMVHTCEWTIDSLSLVGSHNLICPCFLRPIIPICTCSPLRFIEEHINNPPCMFLPILQHCLPKEQESWPIYSKYYRR